MTSRPDSQVPLLLVDVDGVISLYGFESDRLPPGRFQTVEGIGHYLSATAGAHLRRLHRHFELVWCTGWEERANEHLVPALGLRRRLPHLTFTDPPGVAARHWKLEAIERHAGPSRPLAWIDDDHSGCEEWALQRPGPTLLVTTAPALGITHEHVERLIAWAAESSG
ncbi:MAG: HAD domain-containing protein [Solirubrobacteraceae bacterium]